MSRFYNIASQSAQGGVDLRHKDGVASDSLELIRQKGNLPDDFVPSVGDETKGSAFLAQVKSLFHLYVIHGSASCIRSREYYKWQSLEVEPKKFNDKQGNPINYVIITGPIRT